MSLYQTVKSAITVRQVGEMYGMEPDRHGMVCCPFHSDSDPSMKLNDTYYYCFGCGANGDAIDLTAKLFDLNPRQAAEKLMHDFGLDPDKPPANAIALPPPKRGLTIHSPEVVLIIMRRTTSLFYRKARNQCNIKTAYLRYAIQRCCRRIKKLNCYKGGTPHEEKYFPQPLMAGLV